ncbi:hypothetical protein L210DRAFT_3536530 [Boletus edulis BED1]|uniref:Uncharacterized protein n=1 Tax=Boletus edulis BED1 TaxID=1328754 RepID=A0AAD4GFV5_BOLED|nr:hypothetical protein L210DRAFT_3536530 [Boletus edulis BED1]
MKLVYMKHRRIGTIHAPPLPRPTSTFGLDKEGNRDRGLLVGCLGSPTWETSLTSKSDGTSRRQRQRSSFAYQLHTRSTTRSKSKNSSSGSHSTAFASYSMHADRLVLPSSSGASRIPPESGGSASEPLPTHYHPRYGDFGEFHGVRSPHVPVATRRASPCSIRLVDGPSESKPVEYTFLSALPPNGIVASPLMGTRDSFQLTRCALKCHGKPVPPMPSLPLFLPFSLPNDPPPVRAREYLPPLRFSLLASVAKVFHSSHQVFEKKASIGRIPELDGLSGIDVFIRWRCSGDLEDSR